MADTNMNTTEELEPSGYEHLFESGQALEDPYDFIPRVVTQTPGAMEDIQQKLRIGGMALRKHYNESLKKNPEKWKALRAPASMQSTQRTLAEMMLSIPDVDRTQFQGHQTIALCFVELNELPLRHFVGGLPHHLRQ